MVGRVDRIKDASELRVPISVGTTAERGEAPRDLAEGQVASDSKREHHPLGFSRELICQVGVASERRHRRLCDLRSAGPEWLCRLSRQPAGLLRSGGCDFPLAGIDRGKRLRDKGLRQEGEPTLRAKTRDGSREKWSRQVIGADRRSGRAEQTEEVWVSDLLRSKAGQTVDDDRALFNWSRQREDGDQLRVVLGDRQPFGGRSHNISR